MPAHSIRELLFHKRFAQLSESILIWIYSFVAFLTLNPYFLWKTYNNGIFYNGNITTNTILMIISILITTYFIISKPQTLSLLKSNFFVSIYLVLLGFWLSFISAYGVSFVPARILPFISISLFTMLTSEHRKRIFECFSRIYMIFLVPAITIWIMNTLDMNVTYRVLLPDNSIKENAGVYYKLYFFAVENITGFASQITRLTGVFDEPGVVGTISALVLSARGFEFRRNWTNRIIFIGGFLSFSIAFFILSFLFFIFKAIKQKNTRSFIILLIVILIYSVFVSISFRDEFFKSLQGRLMIQDGFLVGDNRTTELFDNEFSRFISSNSIHLWLGEGIHTASSNEFLAGGSSFKMIIYDNGIIGFVFIIFWILASAFFIQNKQDRNGNKYILVILFMLSMYQRPYIFSLAYAVLLIGGISYQISRKSIFLRRKEG